MAFKTVALLWLLAVSLAAQDRFDPKFSVWKTTNLAGAAEVVTIQQPASASKRVALEVANLYCSVACVIAFERDGTAATATALTINLVSDDAPSAPTAAATAWSGSDVGSGTTLFELNLAAGETKSLNMEGFALQGDGTGKNFTFRTDSITGDAEIYIRWREE